MISCTIPGEMRGKGRPRFAKRGGFVKAYTDDKTTNAEAWIRACVVEQVGALCFDTPLVVTVRIWCAVPASWSKRKRADALAGAIFPTGKPDLDNCAKLIFDALNGVLWRDDKQIIAMHVTKAYAEKPSTRLEVQEA